MSSLRRVTKLRMIILHFLATKSIKMRNREEIIQSDSPLSDKIPRFRCCASRTVTTLQTQIPTHRKGKTEKDNGISGAVNLNA